MSSTSSTALLLWGAGHPLGSLLSNKWFWLSLCIGIPLCVAWFMDDD